MKSETFPAKGPVLPDMRSLAALSVVGLVLAGCGLSPVPAPLPAVADAGPVRLAGMTLGTGKIGREVRKVGPFTAIKIQGAIEAEVQVGAPFAVSAEAESNFLSSVETVVENDTLVVRWKDDSPTGSRKPTRVYVALPKLQTLSASSAATTTIKGNISQSFGVDASGASQIRLVDTVANLTAKASGASMIEAHRLTGQSLRLELSGASQASIGGNVSSVNLKVSGASQIQTVRLTAGTADLKASGASTIEGTMNAEKVTQSSTGASSINVDVR